MFLDCHRWVFCEPDSGVNGWLAYLNKALIAAIFAITAG